MPADMARPRCQARRDNRSPTDEYQQPNGYRPPGPLILPRPGRPAARAPVLARANWTARGSPRGVGGRAPAKQCTRNAQLSTAPPPWLAARQGRRSWRRWAPSRRRSGPRWTRAPPRPSRRPTRRSSTPAALALRSTCCSACQATTRPPSLRRWGPRRAPVLAAGPPAWPAPINSPSPAMLSTRPAARPCPLAACVQMHQMVCSPAIPPLAQRAMLLCLRLLASRGGSALLLAGRRGRAFTQLSAEERERVLQGWRDSANPALQGVRGRGAGASVRLAGYPRASCLADG
jgi:hypothetical protein